MVSLRLPVAVSLAALAGGTAFSTQAEAILDEDMEVITVTSSALSLARDESVSSVDVLDREALQRDLGYTLADTLDRLPGVSTTYFGPASGRPVVRGLGAERVRVLINGLDGLDASSSSPDHAVSADVLGASSVEVLRGPAAIAYGGGAIGGVVNILDGRIPAERPEGVRGEAYAGISSVDDGHQAFGRLTGAVGDIVLQGEYQRRQAGAYAIPGYAESARAREEHHGDDDHDDHDHDHGHGHGHGHDDHDHDHGHDDHDHAYGVAPDTDLSFESWSGAASLVRDWGYVGLAVKRSEGEYGLPGHFHPEDDHDDHDDHHDHDHDHGHGHGHGHHDHDHDHGHDDHDHGDARLFLEQTRIDLRGEVALGGYFDRLRWAAAHADYNHVEDEDGARTVFDKRGFEARFELRHDHGGGNQGAWGGQIFDQDFSSEGAEAFIEPVSTRDLGVFMVERWDRGEWGIEAGARLDHRTLDGVSASRDFTTVSASGSVFVRPADGWFAAATLSRTERAPSDVEVFADGPHLATRAYERGAADLQTETAWSGEVTARYSAEVGLSFEASVFHADYDGFIELFPTDQFDHGLRIHEYGQADARLYGGEARLSVPLGELAGFDLTGAASVDVVRGQFDDGRNLPRIPPVSGVVELGAERGTVSLRTDVRLAASQNRVFETEDPTGGHALWNADISWRPAAMEGLTLFAGVRNITDAEARVHASYLKDFIPLPGRNVRLGLSARF